MYKMYSVKKNGVTLRTYLSDWQLPHFRTGLQIDRKSLIGSSFPAAHVYWNIAL